MPERSPFKRRAFILQLRNIAIGFGGHIPSIGRALARNVAELSASG
jgi:hypothetical protein